MSRLYYRIKLLQSNGEVKYSNCISINKLENNIHIAQNPVNDYLYLGGLSENSKVRITNTTGQVVLEQNASAKNIVINVNSFKSGTYFVGVTNKESGIINWLKFLKL